MPGVERKATRIKAPAEEVAAAFVVAAEEYSLDPTTELIAMLLAQSALETGHWAVMYNFNFGNVKATDSWIAGGGDYTFYDYAPKKARGGPGAPVSENLSTAAKDRALASAAKRTDGIDAMDVVVVGKRDDGLWYCLFWPSHIQTRFRAFESLEAGATAYLAKLAGRYEAALEPARRGNVRGYVTTLRAKGYFTAGLEGYVKSVQSLYTKYLLTAKGAMTDEPSGLMTLSDTGAFRTALDDAAVHASGWYALESGALITKLPVWDAEYDLAARMGFGPASEWLAEHGWRLPTAAEMEELHRMSFFVKPYTMPTQQMVVQAGIRQTQEAINVYRSKHMMSHRWCAQHDMTVWDMLAEQGWDGEAPVANFGKHWIDPSGTIFGWWKRALQVDKIQNPSTFHKSEPTYSDYATNFFAARDNSPTKEIIEGVKAAADGPDTDLRLGLRCLEWMGYQLGLGVAEKPGAAHDPRILSYSKQCRRGGIFLGVGIDGAPMWEGGGSTALGRDEDPWCAAITSAALLNALVAGEEPPHGLRVAVRELVEDARAVGTLRPPEYVPKPGDLAIEARAGGDPLEGGTGHVRRVVLVEADRYRGMGGNESNRIQLDWHPLLHMMSRGWIEV